MGNLFGSAAEDGQRQLRADTKKYTKKGLKQLNSRPILSRLDAERERLRTQGITPFSYQGPGYGINIDNTGNIGMTRTAESQGVMDRLLGGLSTDEAAYGDLLSQITPGFGRLSNARRDEIERAAQKGVGNLRDQLARRRVAGSSFANDQIGSLRAEYDALKEKSLAESMVQELQMTQDVIGARTNARNATISQAFQNIQFEGNLGGQLMQSVLGNMNNLQMAQVELAKTAALIQADIQKARANVVTTMGSTMTGQASDFANIQAQIDAGPGQLIGQIGGTALGAYLGNPAAFGGT